jgi:hypothetical protein
MAFKMLEFVCRACEGRFEFLAEGAEVEMRVKACDWCGAAADRVISAPGLHLINTKNSDFRERQYPRLRQRAADHSRRTKDDQIDRERAQIFKMS